MDACYLCSRLCGLTVYRSQFGFLTAELALKASADTTSVLTGKKNSSTCKFRLKMFFQSKKETSHTLCVFHNPPSLGKKGLVKRES